MAVTGGETFAESPDLETINRAIADKGASWVAKAGPFVGLSEEEVRHRTGVVLDESALERHRRQPAPDLARVIANIGMPARNKVEAPAIEATTKLLVLRAEMSQLANILPPWWCWLFEVDWRMRWGRNCVSLVTDQGGCGSCVSFGAIATLESMVMIERNLSVDLSEAELLFCGGGSCGGWWPDSAVSYLMSQGVSQESCFPYAPHDMPCSTCSLRSGEAIKVTTNVTIFDVTQRKDYLWAVGPMMAVFEVFPDFGGYHTGVYSPTLPPYPTHPLHCVEVIGYDDCAGCWICKNSWGSGWGDKGFFRIAYGQCQMDTSFPFWGISKTEWWS
jgi:hypothetical protein